MNTAADKTIGSAVLRVHFVRRGDRYGHVIIGGPGAQTLLESNEGTAEDFWPQSPPLQELHLQCDQQSEKALLVGMAGRSHWSASFELDTAADTLTVDVACRQHGTPDWLGSTYSLGKQVTLSPTGNGYELSATLERLELLPTLGQINVQRIASQDIQLSVTPFVYDGKQVATIRWRYVVRALVDADGTIS